MCGVVISDGFTQRWLRCEQAREVLVAHTLADVCRMLQHAESEAVTHGRYVVGYLAYEAAAAFDSALVTHPPGEFPLAYFAVFDCPHTDWGQDATCYFAEPRNVSVTAREVTSCVLTPRKWTMSVSAEEYREAVGRVKEYIAAGDTYQVNFSYRLRGACEADPWELFRRMVGAQGACYGAYIDMGDRVVCSASPELFFSLEGEKLVSRPMKGTMARGMTQQDDLAQAEKLRNSEKNRAENLMIVDMVRNDMGRVADIGGVTVPRLFAIEKYPTLWQMTSTVECTTHASVADVFTALFPAASITGAPKVRTMELINELENSPRNVYTGAIGFIGPGRRAQFNVAIRTVVVDRRAKSMEYGVGGGIVWDSEARDEEEECRTKTRVIAETIPEFALLESLVWTPGSGYSLLERHLQRLADSAEYFDREIDIDTVRDLLMAKAKGLSAESYKVRLLVPRDGEPAIEASPLVPHPLPYRIAPAAEPVDSSDCFLYHKTTHRKVYEDALASAPGYRDVLLWNERGEVTESCTANVLFELDGALVTPPVECGLLAGTYRAQMLEEERVSERVVKVAELAGCTKIWLMNSVRGMWETELGTGHQSLDICH